MVNIIPILTSKISYVEMSRSNVQKEVLKMLEIKSCYEFVLVVSVKLGEKSDELVEKFKNLIESKAELVNINNWGKKKLAYPIKKEAEGLYVVFDFKSEPSFPKELDRISGITDGILRSMIIRK